MRMMENTMETNILSSVRIMERAWKLLFRVSAYNR